MSQQAILAAAKRAYTESVCSRYYISFSDWLKQQQQSGYFWGIPQEGEDNDF